MPVIESPQCYTSIELRNNSSSIKGRHGKHYIFCLFKYHFPIVICHQNIWSFMVMMGLLSYHTMEASLSTSSSFLHIFRVYGCLASRLHMTAMRPLTTCNGLCAPCTYGLDYWVTHYPSLIHFWLCLHLHRFSCIILLSQGVAHVWRHSLGLFLSNYLHSHAQHKSIIVLE